MDRISHLPESVIHHIISYLVPAMSPPKDLVRLSVLSKNWFALTASFPILVFNFHMFASQESFFKYVEYTTSRFCHKNVTAAQVFKLATTVQTPAEKYVIDKCLELVLNKGVREMEINVIKPLIRSYCLSPLPSSLNSSLTISAFVVLPYNSSMVADAVMFKSLIRLTLENVRIDDEWIKHLSTGCPLLQELKITTCDGFKSFCVYGHQNLQEVSINYETPLERIDIDAPNLSHISVDDMHDSGPPRMNLVSCEKLTRVTYNGYLLPNDFISNFPFIENLRLTTDDDDDTCNNLEWSSHSLKTLVLQSGCDLNGIELNTPNLALFSFIVGSSWSMPDEGWPLVGDLTQLKACMRCYHDGYIDANWLQKLRQFFEKKNGFKALNLYIHTIRKFVELKNLPEIKLPPYELKHVELELDIDKESSDHVAFVATVLWFFSPQFLTLRSLFPLTDSEEHNDDIVKPICEKLLQQEDQGQTSIQVAVSNEGKTISFIKKEESG